MTTLTHLDEKNQPAMVDVSAKAITRRSATARCIVALPDAVWEQLHEGDIITKKGSVVQTATIAGVMAAKKTSELIPFCHPLGLEDCKISLSFSAAQEVIIECTAVVTAKTGVEMEALTGATVAALTLYDMCKALSHDITIKETALLAKSGGKHDFNR